MKENSEILETSPNDFFASELEGALLRVIPAKEEEISGDLIEDEVHDPDGSDPLYGDRDGGYA